MWCRTVRSQLSAYADGELAPSVAMAVEEHLHRCEQCAAERANLQQLVHLTALVPEEEAPTPLRSQILVRLAYAPTTPAPALALTAPHPFRRNLNWGWAAFAGAAAVLAIAAVYGQRGFGPSRNDERPMVRVHSVSVAKREHPAEAERGTGPRRTVLTPRRPSTTGSEARTALSSAHPDPSGPSSEAKRPSAAEASAKTLTASAGSERTPPRRGPLGERATWSRTRPQVSPNNPVAPAVPASEPVTSSPSAPMMAVQPDGMGMGMAMPGEPVVNTAGMVNRSEPTATSPDREPPMKMMAGAPSEAEKSATDEDEGLRMLRSFLEERSRTIPQPPLVEPMGERRQRKSL